jgi:hypothetical protein
VYLFLHIIQGVKACVILSSNYAKCDMIGLCARTGKACYCVICSALSSVINSRDLTMSRSVKM